MHRLVEAGAALGERLSPTVRRVSRHWASGDTAAMLEALAVVEEKGFSAPQEVARALEADICEFSRRVVLAEAAASALLRHPHSPILLYLRVLGLIDQHKFEEAHGLVSASLSRLCDQLRSNAIGSARAREQAQALIALWRIVDSGARDQMSWVVVDHQAGAAYAKFDFVEAFESLPADAPWRHHLTTLAFAEPLLQGKQIAQYVERCRIAFDQAPNLLHKLHAIRALCRQGLRRIPDHSREYDEARHLFAQCRPKMDAAIAGRKAKLPKDARAYVRWLRSAHSLALQLGEKDDAERLGAELLDCVRGASGTDGRWMAAGALAQAGEHLGSLSEFVGPANPEHEQDLRDFYQFALHTGEYDRAHAVFAALPEISRRRSASLVYADILQSSQRFDEAERVVRAVHASMLSNVDALDYFASHRLIRRAGALKFAAETARHFEAVPQPQSPKGVIFATPRTLEQLRRTPIVVFLEWKRMGWAVVPLFEGVLPVQKTGIDEIDRLAACIRTNNEFRPGAEAWLKTVEPLDVDYDTGRLGWRGIDLSHAMWEEAAINRRVYSVAWACPALRRSLGGLVGWTTKYVRVLETIRETFGALDIRAGIHVFMNFRLPDAVVRFYCEQYGDPQRLFCIHASNGYENYFVNFNREVSTRLTIRNMTAHRETRGSSMPLPEHVIAATSGDREAVERSLAHLLKTPRSKPDGHSANAQRELALQKILDWKSSGGSVACAFGKVVCDSGVPFDGGPCHASMSEWINDTIDAVKGSRTMLLIKPHPHELREEIACFLNETFRDLVPDSLPDNVIYLGHDWFEAHELKNLIDLALIYNGTTSVEMALLEVPTVLAGHFAPIDYPLGQTTPADRQDYHRLVRFERKVAIPPDGRLRAAAWLNLMRNEDVSVPYRYHSRQITNRVVYPPYWFDGEVEAYLEKGDSNVRLLAERGIEFGQG